VAGCKETPGLSDTCECCADQAVAARVLALLPDGMACVEINGVTEEVSVELTDSVPGDIVMVHAKVAIARVSGEV